MTRGTLGAIFCFIGALLIAVQYISSAIHSLSAKWGSFTFGEIMDMVGRTPLYLGFGFITLGIVYTISGINYKK